MAAQQRKPPAPIDLVVLTRARLQEVVDEAVRRGRITRSDATDLVSELGEHATAGTAQAIRRVGVPVERVAKIQDGSPNVVDLIESGEVKLVINTPTGSGARVDGYEIRRAATARGIPCITTLTGASAAQRAIVAMRRGVSEPRSLQELHGAAVPTVEVGAP